MTLPSSSSASGESASSGYAALSSLLLNFKLYCRYAWILLVPLIIFMILGAAWPLANTLLFSFTEASADNMNHSWFNLFDRFGNKLFAVK